MKNPRIDEVLESDENAAEQPVEPVLPEAPPRQPAAQVKPWVHFFAGGIAGMTGAILTSPLDVVKTRLQSDLSSGLSKQAVAARHTAQPSRFVMVRVANHVFDTFGIISSVYRTEGVGALFRGLGPNLAGVVPARAVNFFTYGAAKEFLAPRFGDVAGDQARTHLASGICAGLVTSTATNPIWLVKTRMQLDRAQGGTQQRLYRNSIDCVRKIVRNEGVFALYRGLSASFLGTTESSMQWVLYEQMRGIIRNRQARRYEQGYIPSRYDRFADWLATSGTAGAAKFIASLITYPHEVVRTRLRQAPLEVGGKPKYTGLVQCFRRLIAEEGLASLYGGLTPHLLRTVPNSIIMFGTWDLIIRLVA